jgi:hypothetical protein
MERENESGNKMLFIYFFRLTATVLCLVLVVRDL